MRGGMRLTQILECLVHELIHSHCNILKNLKVIEEKKKI